VVNIAVIVALALSAAAQAKHTHDGGPFSPQGQRTSGTVSAPYQQLFLVPGIPPTVKGQAKAQEEALRAAQKRLVHHGRSSLFEEGPCGMPVIVARPEVDPKIDRDPSGIRERVGKNPRHRAPAPLRQEVTNASSGYSAESRST
jgi:hypothetical protein